MIQCPNCGGLSELYSGPPCPWDPIPYPKICASCENKAEEAYDREQLENNIQAAARSGRLDLI